MLNTQPNILICMIYELRKQYCFHTYSSSWMYLMNLFAKDKITEAATIPYNVDKPQCQFSNENFFQQKKNSFSF